MTKGFYHQIREAWKSPDLDVLRKRMTDWRKTDSIVTVDKPLRLDRARALGYKAKKGFVVARVRIRRGGHKKPRPVKGRRSKRMTTRKTLKMSYQWIAQQRAERKYTNLVVLNSYQIGKDGSNYFFEVIMIDPQMPEIKNDPAYAWITKGTNQKRSMRGITSAARKSRGLNASIGRSPKVRPSGRANKNKGK
ncbi:50S ribosomal protein L15e [Candidatus Pacearchaeota archaeon CG10_big_fil_rev_8_21_14_0_10_32_14]|nr:MAG: 50S ribosomal protein L15e [Candidatus Pacearchaeota archaeon CG10_big_fil_rev_8_21_14_0_10_32_14]